MRSIVSDSTLNLDQLCLVKCEVDVPGWSFDRSSVMCLRVSENRW